MSVFKCKMCGGTIEFAENATVGTCDSCGTKQTLPRLSDDRRANLYDRANHFRRNNEFDKAMGIYEKILSEDNTDAEAYWSLVLCRYGIEYVEDPASHKRVPTVNRAQFTSIFDDDNYRSALQYADGYQRSIYEAEAAAINEIQKGILAISQKEEPFDVFICYKETDSYGRRTPDSVLATDLYHQLTQEGFKVFFARITLEDKLGAAYEPYIFAALNSARVMVVLGTKPEYFNAVWVKNEWSRYLSLVKQSGGKKVLIPAFKDMDPYDLPEEFSHLQAQDMGKLGFMQDLIRGIKKLAQPEVPKATAVVRETVVTASGNVAPLLRRAFLFLEDRDWDSADEYCEKVLDLDPECAEAYLGKLMAEMKIDRREALRDAAQPFDGKNNYQKAIRFGDAKLKAELTGYIEHINTRNEIARLDGIYAQAKQAMDNARTEAAYQEAANRFASIPMHRDAAAQAEKCRELAENTRKDAIYVVAQNMMNSVVISYVESAEQAFASISGWKDADEQRQHCLERIEKMKADAEAARQEAARQAEITRKNAIYADAQSKMNSVVIFLVEAAEKAFASISGHRDADEQRQRCLERIKKLKAEEEAARKKAERAARRKRLLAAVAAVAAVLLVVYVTVIRPMMQYNSAVALMEAGKYTEAITAFEAMEGYKDSDAKIAECQIAIKDIVYNYAVTLMEAGKYTEAITAFETMDGYKDSVQKIEDCRIALKDIAYSYAVSLMESGSYTKAISAFEAMDGYKDSVQKIEDCRIALKDIAYEEAVALMEAGKTGEAYEAFAALDGHKDSNAKATECRYCYAIDMMEANKTVEAYEAFLALNGYKDSTKIARKLALELAGIDANSLQIGNRVILGSYEQDNNGFNGTEDIQWRVLAKENNRVLLISEYALEARPYNTELTDVTWESCTLRSWLNREFYNKAFTSAEQAIISTTTVKAHKNPDCNTNPGNDTRDKVFLLSIQEVNQHFGSDEARKCIPTEYAIAQGAWTSDSNKVGGKATCWWWLRSPGYTQNFAAYVLIYGGIPEAGYNVNHVAVCVRPALWIDLES